MHVVAVLQVKTLCIARKFFIQVSSHHMFHLICHIIVAVKVIVVKGATPQVAGGLTVLGRTVIVLDQTVIIIMIIIIIAFKGTVRDCFTISSQRCEPSPTSTLKWPRRNHVQITCNTSSAYHVQHVMLLPPGMKGQLSY